MITLYPHLAAGRPPVQSSTALPGRKRIRTYNLSMWFWKVVLPTSNEKHKCQGFHKPLRLHGLRSDVRMHGKVPAHVGVNAQPNLWPLQPGSGDVLGMEEVLGSPGPHSELGAPGRGSGMLVTGVHPCLDTSPLSSCPWLEAPPGDLQSHFP